MRAKYVLFFEPARRPSPVESEPSKEVEKRHRHTSDDRIKSLFEEVRISLHGSYEIQVSSAMRIYFVHDSIHRQVRNMRIISKEKS